MIEIVDLDSVAISAFHGNAYLVEWAIAAHGMYESSQVSLALM